jgi:hypothetical protein
MTTRVDHLRNRAFLVDRLRREVVGPDAVPGASVLNPEPRPRLTWDELRSPRVQPNGEEILTSERPLKRYGAGILYPAGVTHEREVDAETRAQDATEETIPESEDHAADGSITDGASDGDDNYDVNLANAFRPAAMALSFLVDLGAESRGLVITLSGAIYRPFTVDIARESGNATQQLWFRYPLRSPESGDLRIPLSVSDVLGTFRSVHSLTTDPAFRVDVVVLSRPLTAGPPDQRLVTVSLVNRETPDGEGPLDGRCLFQAAIRVEGADGSRSICPYPSRRVDAQDPLDDERINDLLYREFQTFAVGHGCAATWPPASDGRATAVESESLPIYETPSLSGDLIDSSGQPLRIDMRKLAGLVPGDDGVAELRQVIQEYRLWIGRLETGLPTQSGVARPPVPSSFGPTTRALLDRCRTCVERMEAGLELLTGDGPHSQAAREAFRLANWCMLEGQFRASREVRRGTWGSEDNRWRFEPALADCLAQQPRDNRGFWRPFQIAFVLLALNGVCSADSADRLVVDLIWFPTGGGKTEAYLCLTAFVCFFDRFVGVPAGSTRVFMRYTLRLLSAQQFQRAALLFCAMERARQKAISSGAQPFEKCLSSGPFSLGLWVGGTTTPNTRQAAVNALSQLRRDATAQNPFVLLKCPWCSAQFGPLADGHHDTTAQARRGRHRRGSGLDRSRVLGYELAVLDGLQTIVFRCPDQGCEFSAPSCLPVTVIDEDILRTPPDLVIATVDKLAMLAWKPELRRLFGLSDDGTRAASGPTLIVQDELHLISGPLGSMVGLYETLVEELSITGKHRPKIIGSTATISRAGEQVSALYARSQVVLFPPSGLEAGDSFFARYTRDEDGTLASGRLYVGVLAPSHGSLQTTQARVYATLLQGSAMFATTPDNEAAERDPWWTLVAFFNSLRELGGASTLLVADARDYLRVILNRYRRPYTEIRQLLNWVELTSRIRSDEVPATIQRLEATFRRDAHGHVVDALDVCLASNIIEVGIDIDRLAVMTIIGQPKTTSQYIQVSSRIGRRPDTPGLVVVAYSPSKPRDRSHYERFRTYHQALYSHVEPTSVTPFSPPAVDRGLHGILVGAVRQLGTRATATSPRPFPLTFAQPLTGRIARLFESRSRAVDPEETDSVRLVLNQRMAEWDAWAPAEYGTFGPQPEDPPLLHPAGTRPREAWHGRSWPTLTSLRDVDAECEAAVTPYYRLAAIRQD